MIYLSGTFTNIPKDKKGDFGYMLNVMRQIGGEREAMEYPWMLDNGAFGDKWNIKTWQARLSVLSVNLFKCIGTVAPDVVGNSKATRQRWDQLSYIPKKMGYKVFYATQDGCTVDEIPWGEIDGLFVGGSNQHKEVDSFPLIREAKDRGFWVHVGRVNSPTKIRKFCAADSVDGTRFVFDSNRRTINGILRGVRFCNQVDHGQLSFLDSLQQHTQL